MLPKSCFTCCGFIVARVFGDHDGKKYSLYCVVIDQLAAQDVRSGKTWHRWCSEKFCSYRAALVASGRRAGNSGRAVYCLFGKGRRWKKRKSLEPEIRGPNRKYCQVVKSQGQISTEIVSHKDPITYLNLPIVLQGPPNPASPPQSSHSDQVETGNSQSSPPVPPQIFA